MNIILQSDSVENTKQIGLALGTLLRKLPTVLLMTGDLGSGKTTISQAIVKGFGIDDYVTSPTYTLVNVYEQAALKFYHFDLYRLTDVDELFEIGFDEIIAEKVPVIIEWPELIDDYDFEYCLRLNIQYGDSPNSRIIEIETKDWNLEKELHQFG